MGLGKHLSVPLGYSATPHCPSAAGVHKGPKFPEDQETKSLGGGQDASRSLQSPTSWPFHMQFLWLDLPFAPLSPSRVIFSKPDSSGKPSQITRSFCESLILKLPPCTLSTWLLCCSLVVSCSCLSLHLNCELLKRKRERAIFFTPFVPLGSFTLRQELVSARQPLRHFSGKNSRLNLCTACCHPPRQD